MTSHRYVNQNYEDDEDDVNSYEENEPFDIELFTFARAYIMQYVDMYYEFTVINLSIYLV